MNFSDIRSEVLRADIGIDLPIELGEPATECDTDAELCLAWGDTARLRVTGSADGVCHRQCWAQGG